MSTTPSPSPVESTPAVSRRQFVALAAGCAALCACGGVAGAAPAKSSEPIDVGAIADYGKDGITDKFVKSHSLFVIREEDKIYACTSLCTHKGAQMRVKDGTIYCAKHGSVFSTAGTVTKGPASSSLERYAISKNDAGHLIVDPTKPFREKNWSDAASYVKA